MVYPHIRCNFVRNKLAPSFGVAILLIYKTIEYDTVDDRFW